MKKNLLNILIYFILIITIIIIFTSIFLIFGKTKKYACYNGNCIEDPYGEYTDSNCGGQCSTQPITQKYACYNGKCIEDPYGNYTDSNCGGQCSIQPIKQKYSCYNGKCIVDTNGNYTDSNCGGQCSVTEHKWKQVTYVGYSMTYDQFNSFIDICKTNGITHIILEFILFGSNFSVQDGNWGGLEIADTFHSWANFTTDQKQYLINKINKYSITLMASFGGATSFGNFTGSKYFGFQYTWQNPNSKYYIVTGGKYDSIEKSATALGNDLADLLTSNNIEGIDFDIENIPNIGTYKGGPYSDIYNYLGFMSKAAKENGITTVSHAPQTPYFYPQTDGSWPQLYYNVEETYGEYIDFYNIQYYNNGAYSSELELFTNDERFQASVNQLITANDVQGLIKIPTNKIVLGKAVDAAWPRNSLDWTDLTKYVQNQKTSLNQNLVNWYKTGGVMTWLYRLDSNQETNQYLLTYFNTLKSPVS
jgi:hypothetical protein